MNSERLEYFKAKLETLVEELRQGIKSGKDATATVKLDTSIGRLSRMDAMQSQQMALELQRRQENQLLRVENALKRIKQNSYGDCGTCKKPIPENRLEHQPDAVQCIQCAERR